jgi:NitT/TauT family transport system substrate-binding protein
LAPDNEPPPELTAIRMAKTYAACAAPILAAEAFLFEEGFTDVQYETVELKYSLITDHLLSGKMDMSFNFTPALLHAVDEGLPLVMLGGAHVACFQIIAADHVAGLSDLRGRRLGMFEHDPQPSDFAFLTSVMQYIGLTAGRDFELIEVPRGRNAQGEGLTPRRMFDGGYVDAVMTLQPIGLELSSIGHVILDSLRDDPWRQNLCCILSTRREFFEQYPVATKRAMRAVYRGIDRCAREPEAVAQLMVDRGWILTLPKAMEALHEVAFERWREQDAQDTIRFHALRLAEAGVIKSTPDEMIEKGTDFTYFNELKEELAMFAAPREGASAAAFECEIDTRAGRLAQARTPAQNRRGLG